MAKWNIVICHAMKRSWVQTLLITFSKTICWWTVHIPYGIHVESMSFHPFHMEYVLAGIPAILVIPFHMESIWNDMESMWIPSFHMEFPCGFHMESGIRWSLTGKF